jgi:hypothetical protein
MLSSLEEWCSADATAQWLVAEMRWTTEQEQQHQQVKTEDLLDVCFILQHLVGESTGEGGSSRCLAHV